MLLEIKEETGKPPQALLDMPRLEQYVELQLAIFRELSGSRQIGFDGPGEIPFSEVYLYGAAHGYSRSETAELWDEIHRIDVIWLSAASKFRESHKSAK